MLRIFSHDLYDPGSVLQLLPVYAGAGNELLHLCHCGVFRDLSQIINIALQVGMWATPILWDIGMIKDENILVLVKLNPLVYIVNGYRNAIYGGEWFFEHFYSSTYFWILQ